MRKKNGAIFMVTTFKYAILFIAFVLITNLNWAQIGTPDNLDVIYGKEIKNNKSEPISKVLGADESGCYVLGKSGDEITIYYYSKKLTLVRKKMTVLVDKGITYEYIGVYELGDQFVLLTSYVDKKNKVSYLYSHALNKERLTFSAPNQLLAISYVGFKRNQYPQFNVGSSANLNYLLITSDLPRAGENATRLGMLMLNKNMNVDWRKDSLDIKNNNPYMAKNTVKVGDNGNVYLLAEIIEKVPLGSLPKKKFQIQVYKKETDLTEVSPVDMGNKVVNDVTFNYTKDGRFHIVGLYTGKNGFQKGVINIVMDADNLKVLSKTETDFPADFIAQHMREKEKRKFIKRSGKGKEIGFSFLQLDRLIENENGSVTMIAEEYRYFQNCYTDFYGAPRCTDNYVYGNILVMKFNLVGQVEWMDLVPKYQHTTNDGGYYSGYSFSKLKDGAINLIFNDSPKNNYYEETTDFYNWVRTSDRTDIVVYNIEEEGKVNRFVLLRGSVEDVMLRPNLSKQLNDNEVIILGEERERAHFYKLIYK